MSQPSVLEKLESKYLGTASTDTLRDRLKMSVKGTRKDRLNVSSAVKLNLETSSLIPSAASLNTKRSYSMNVHKRIPSTVSDKSPTNSSVKVKRSVAGVGEMNTISESASGIESEGASTSVAASAPISPTSMSPSLTPTNAPLVNALNVEKLVEKLENRVKLSQVSVPDKKGPFLVVPPTSKTDFNDYSSSSYSKPSETIASNISSQRNSPYQYNSLELKSRSSPLQVSRSPFLTIDQTASNFPPSYETPTNVIRKWSHNVNADVPVEARVDSSQIQMQRQLDMMQNQIRVLMNQNRNPNSNIPNVESRMLTIENQLHKMEVMLQRLESLNHISPAVKSSNQDYMNSKLKVSSPCYRLFHFLLQGFFVLFLPLRFVWFAVAYFLKNSEAASTQSESPVRVNYVNNSLLSPDEIPESFNSLVTPTEADSVSASPLPVSTTPETSYASQVATARRKFRSNPSIK